jgi:hypothetical protein
LNITGHYICPCFKVLKCTKRKYVGIYFFVTTVIEIGILKSQLHKILMNCKTPGKCSFAIFEWPFPKYFAIFKVSILHKLLLCARVARFFWHKIPKTWKNTKLPLHCGNMCIPNDHKICQNFHSTALQILPKLGFLVWKIYHLATLPALRLDVSLKCSQNQLFWDKKPQSWLTDWKLGNSRSDS